MRKKKNKRRKKYKKFKRRYAVMRDGNVYFFKDSKNTFTALHADGENSEYLGKSKIRNSTRAQVFRKANWRCNYMFHYFRKALVNYDIDVDKCIIISGCFNTNMHTLQRTMTPENTGKFSAFPNAENIKIYNNVIKHMFRKLKFIKRFDTPTFNDVFYTKISEKKKPGFRYEEYFKMQNKGEALHSAMEIAKLRWQYLSETPIEKIDRDNMYHGVYTVGARNKRDYSYDEDEIAVSRAVHMPELHVELTSAPWFDTFTEFIKEEKKGPIYIGNSILEASRLKRDAEESAFILEGDFKRFDSTLYLIAITCGLAFVRCFFDLGSSYVDSHFCGIYDSLSIKDYYVVGGKVFRMYHGLPSGVKSTSLLGSILNLMSLMFCVKNEFKAFNFIVGGDDFLIISKKPINNTYAFVERVKHRVTMIGMKFKFLDVKHFTASRISDCPTFYKYCIYKGKAITPTQAMLERVLMPWNKNYDTDIKLFQFLKDVMPSLGEPMSHLYIYYRFYQYMYGVVTGTRIRMSEIVAKHKAINEKMHFHKNRTLLYKYKNGHEDDEGASVSYVLYKRRNVVYDIKPDLDVF